MIYTQGEHNDNIRSLQEDMIQIGFPVGTNGADGIFDSDTLCAVIAFQNYYGLPPSGMLDEVTQDKILRILEGKEDEIKYTVIADNKQIGRYSRKESVLNKVASILEEAHNIQISR